ncbi:WD40-repeat-containing domain protein [Trametes gibbosa]|nr:WD40-repeat-containing domain protein [Trametes gibbosa]
MDTPAYNIYAQQLLPRKHGYALWHPEHTKFGEIHIGDVGYFREGAFYRLFNATSHEDEAQKYGVPQDYHPFFIKEYLLNQTKDVIKANIVSKSVTSYDVSGNAGTTLQAVGAGLKFTCEREHGAFVFVKPAADRWQMHPSKGLVQYIRTNFDSWYHFATDVCDLEIDRDEIIFVSGVVKTADWGLGAFLRQGSGGEVSFQTNLGPFAQGSFNFSRAHKSAGVAEWRTKPDGASMSPQPSVFSESTTETLVGSSSMALTLQRTHSGPRKDQCLFLHYYKMKRRLWLNKVIKAAAGPDRPGSDSGNDDGDQMLEDSDIEDVVEEPGIVKTYDPLDHILNYILNYKLEDDSQVDTAIAGTEHLYALFDEEFPEDIEAALQERKPAIMFVDEGVAALACAEWSEEYNEAEEPEYGRAQSIQHAPKAGPSVEANIHNSGEAGRREQPQSPKDSEDLDRTGGRTTAAQTYASVVWQDHTGGVGCVAWSPDGTYLASGSEDTTIILRDGDSGESIHQFTDHHDSVWSLAFSPDGCHLASGASDGTAIIHDIEMRSVTAMMHGHTGVIQSIQYSQDGSKIVTASVDMTLRLWEASSGALLHTMKHDAVVMNAIFSPNGQLVGSCSADYFAKIWDAKTGRLLHGLAHHGAVWSVAFDPESRRIVTGADDASSVIWSAESGEALVILREHPAPVWAVAFSPDGRRVMSASNDMSLKICDSFTGELLHTLTRNDALVNVAVFSPDGEYIASGGGANEVHVWNAHTGKGFPAMGGHFDKITALQFSPENDRIVSSSDDGTVRIWTLLESGLEED